MRDKVKGTILAAAGGIGTVWLLANFTPWVPWAVAFVFCATVCVDGIATVAGEIRTDRAIKKAREKYRHDMPHYLNLYK